MTEAELLRLLDVARRRPLLDAMTIRRGKDAGQPKAKVRPKTRRRLERLGRERALIYKTLALTGLRRGELESITVGQVELDAEPPFLTLGAADEKSREGAQIPLRSDLADDLAQWSSDELETIQAQCRSRGEPIPMKLSPHRRLFNVPKGLGRILDRDLKLAGIPKQDDRGRTIDVHALRHTFGTLLSKAGVAPRTAQAAMRHSDIDLTMNVYTDPKLLDVQGAVEALPSLPVEGAVTEAQQASGTEGASCQLAPKSGKGSESGTIVDNTPNCRVHGTDQEPIDVSVEPVKRKTLAVKG